MGLTPNFAGMKTKKMRIQFDGDTHQIDSNTLVNCLIHYNAIVAIANDMHGGGDRKVSVKVNALEKGSFVIDLSLCGETIASLFSKDNMDYLADLVAIFGGVWAVYKIFKGRPVSSDEDRSGAKAVIRQVAKNASLRITNTIVNIYNRQDTRQAVSDSISTADADGNVDGIEISSDVISPVSVKREEFKDLEYDGFDQENGVPREMVDEVEARLTIIGLNFDKGNRWQFLYNGFKISMVVKDDALMQRIDAGERFGKGDSILVKMRILKVFNPVYNAYENKSYRILEFYEHIIPPRQADIGFV